MYLLVALALASASPVSPDPSDICGRAVRNFATETAQPRDGKNHHTTDADQDAFWLFVEFQLLGEYLKQGGVSPRSPEAARIRRLCDKRLLRWFDENPRYGPLSVE